MDTFNRTEDRADKQKSGKRHVYRCEAIRETQTVACRNWRTRMCGITCAFRAHAHTVASRARTLPAEHTCTPIKW